MSPLLSLLLATALQLTDIAHPDECPEMVTRAQWGARPPTARETMKTPVPFVVIHHTYKPGFCATTEDCKKAMRTMQDMHQFQHKWNDIGYNFVVGGDGKVYEGRGWGIVGAHAPNYNSRSIGISFIGDYTSNLPTPAMLEAGQQLIRCGVARGQIAADYKLLGHRQVRATECPGDAFFANIQKWPHWSSLRDIVPRL
ncbi:peptidoglycan-recognition protein LB-like isoform X1 [Schistocerca americana]|uniref:peptidoglycan-recognition protein LB-like isoform X1 n=1 Tax=Schistocerca americana TaxID=7009 RepID=UPI001F4FFFBA|nr:peptidoglycan-recognition protein LB-like isoform X1 [Schistocerca americana]